VKAGQGNYGRVRLLLNIYIAIAVTVLGLMILKSAGTNATQNREIAEQARALAQATRASNFEGCQRGNFVRTKINTVSGALSRLLHRSVTENQAEGVQLTAEQQKFLDQLYEELAPLKPVDCKKEYGR